jgi:hypothetical protein
MSKLTLLGADLGRGHCKLVALVISGGRVEQVKRAKYPTVLGQQSSTAFRGVTKGATLNGTAVTVHHPQLGTRICEVGDDALSHSRATWAARSRYQEKVDLVALLGYGVKKMGLSGEIHLCVGTPAQFYDAQKSEQEALFKGEWAIDGIAVNFSAARAIPQPAGSYFNLVADYKTGKDRLGAELYYKGRIGICDVGEFSTDGGVMNAEDWQGNRVVTMEKGVGNLKEALARYLTEQGYPKRAYEVGGLLERREIVLPRKGKLDLQAVVDEAVLLHGAAIVSEFRSEWPDRVEFDRVIISGGGAFYFGRYLRDAWEPHWETVPEAERQVVIVQENPEWANVEGYTAFLHYVWLRQRSRL